MNLQIVHELPTDLWDAFVCRHPFGNIFHTREMFEVFDRARGFAPKMWAALCDGELSAIFIPVQISLTNNPFHHLTTRAVSFGSILPPTSSNRKEILNALFQAYLHSTDTPALFTELRHLFDLEKIQSVLTKNGFKREDHLNYLIDLKEPEEEIIGRFSKSIRKHIRTAQKNKVTIHEITNKEQLVIAYELLKRTYKRIQIPLPHLSFFEAAFDVLASRRMLKGYLLKVNENYISTRLVLAYKDRIIDWYTGSDRSFSNYHPEELAIWHILKWGKAHGYETFDFGGAGRPGERYGPREFKAKFGGTQVNFGRHIYIHHPVLLKISRIGFAMLRRFL